jgi:hypothetical protein
MGGLLAALTVLSGAATAYDHRIPIVFTALGALVLVLLSDRAELLALAGGAVFLLGSTAFGVSKLAYLLVVSLVTAKSFIHRANGVSQVQRFPQHCFLPLTLYLVLSVGVSYAHGIALLPCLRDIAPYLLFVTIPLNANAFAHRVTKRFVEGLFVVLGGATAIGFFINWASLRGLSDLSATYTPLATGTFAMAAASYTFARWLHSGCKGILAPTYGLGTSLLLVLTGSRSSLLIVISLMMTVLLSIGKGFVSASALMRITFGLGIAAVLTFAIGSAVNLSFGKVGERLATLSVLTSSHRAGDQSYIERERQTSEANLAWQAHPLLGMGPGFTFSFYRADKRLSRSAVVDSPFGVFSDYGLFGVASLALCAVGLLGLTIKIGRRSPGAIAMGSLITISLIFAISGSPVEDKGFSMALLFLIILSIQDLHAMAASIESEVA